MYHSKSEWNHISNHQQMCFESDFIFILKIVFFFVVDQRFKTHLNKIWICKINKSDLAKKSSLNKHITKQDQMKCFKTSGQNHIYF